MRFFSPPAPLPRCRHGHRGYLDYAAVKHVRDRGLDHAVEREKHLMPVLALKDLIKSEPSKSLPISTITLSRDSLRVPTRPMDFIRRYPSVFEEFLPAGAGVHPHIRLTPQVLDLDSDEQLVYQSESYKQDLAGRLVKLLMISRVNKLPLWVLDSAKWDLGLPHDYAESIVPEFPDCFRVIGDGRRRNALELVCWSDQLAVSAVERNVNKGLGGCDDGRSHFPFPMKFSKGFEMDKKFKKWMDDWQKLPYVSAYETAVHLGPNSDEYDKWVVGVLHEVLNLFVSKKAERDTLLGLGECLGVRSRIKRALLHHPGIFYLSGKTGTCTVLLKDAYKRGLLIEKNPLTDIRNQYIHLMNKVSKDGPVVSVPGDDKQQEMGKVPESNGQGGNENGDDRAESDDNIGDDQDDCSDDDQECSTSDDEDQKEVENIARTRRNVKSSWTVNADRRATGRNFNDDRRTRGRDFDADRRARGRDFDADGGDRGRDFDADRRARGRDLDPDSVDRGRNFGADRRARGRNFDADRKSRGRDFVADRGDRGRNLDADRGARGRNLDANRGARGRNYGANRGDRGRNFDAARRARGRNFDAGGPSQSSERKIVSGKNHRKTADKGTQRIDSNRKLHTRDRNMQGRSTSDGRKGKLSTEKEYDGYLKA